ncbi:hypothetical protein N7495_007483 [Penicillium taxi]|uniref:uncharacterized protein n=1 Tax=Penicillium taxi TaxID=168475 RepID=UPI002545A85C|nr:uncharacterized protein N7495_007483 [Penicillium taxi]KAJ5887442.1 hypothetical protein N7495_007483 [Penicillium taxi]
MASNPAKRKQFNPETTGAARKRAKTFDARSLAVQSTNAALSATGELDVAAYSSARAFEIQALERGMQRSKDALTTRAFQKVPRSMRRRTASHNVKRMNEDKTPTVTARRRKPSQIMRIRLDTARRLQKLNAKSKQRRAAAKNKEQKDNDTILQGEGSHAFNTAPRIPKIKKNKLSRPLPSVTKYRKRQRSKVWLPTHMYHAKRAHMATTRSPIWRFALPISPTEKSYRPTHRARGFRGAIGWDMSYMSTIQLEGTASAIEAVLRAIGVIGEDAWGVKGKKWRAGTRSLQAWAVEKDQPKRPIAPVTLIWCVESKSEDTEMADADVPQASKHPRRKLWIRIHPSAFLQLWTDLLYVSKKQTPPVMIEDLRFEIGSIEITGPGSTEALLASLRPVLGPEGQAPVPKSPEATWASLLGVSNPSSLPQNALLSFAISDPRLHYPNKTLKSPDDQSIRSDLAILLCEWSPDKTQGPSSLFDRPSRLEAARQLPSQKAINRRRTLSAPGKNPPSQPSDPKIPIIILATRSQKHSKGNSTPGSWTVLLPWRCVVPVWYSLMFYPLSSGGNARFGGLKEQQQLAFEANAPWFPGDFPGTRAGWEWGQSEAKKAHAEWKRRPKGRRAEFDTLNLGANHPKGEVGNGWDCDWKRLIQGASPDSAHRNGLSTQERDNVEDALPINIHNIRHPSSNTDRIINDFIRTPPDSSALATVYITLSSRGTPTPHARIYRLPSEPSLRRKWLELASSSKHKFGNEKNKIKAIATLASEEARRQFAEVLLSRSGGEAGTDHLDIPMEEDLIGFVTTGNYNLSEGQGTGIGSIQISKVLAPDIKINERKICIIRAAGERIGRLGVWELIV